MKITTKSAVFALSLWTCLNATGIVSADPKVIAKVGNTVLTEDEMRSEMGQQLYQAESNLYMTQKSWVDQKSQDILFNQAAKDAKLSRAEWEKREIDAKATPPNEQQVQQMVGQFVRPGVDGKESLKQATDYVTNNNKMMRRNMVYQELAQKTPV